MRILFCNIAWMNKYRGSAEDTPVNGGEYVRKNKDGCEAENFLPLSVSDDNGNSPTMYLGFFETKQKKSSKNRNSTHIEKIIGCDAYKNAPYVDGVLVVWCATARHGGSYVVGWYNNATVYREYQTITGTRIKRATIIPFIIKTYERWCNVTASVDEGILLPLEERMQDYWKVPRRGNWSESKFGFGSAQVWYAREAEAQNFVERIARQISSYTFDINLHQKYGGSIMDKHLMQAILHDVNSGRIGLTSHDEYGITSTEFREAIKDCMEAGLIEQYYDLRSVRIKAGKQMPIKEKYGLTNLGLKTLSAINENFQR